MNLDLPIWFIGAICDMNEDTKDIPGRFCDEIMKSRQRNVPCTLRKKDLKISVTSIKLQFENTVTDFQSCWVCRTDGRNIRCGRENSFKSGLSLIPGSDYEVILVGNDGSFYAFLRFRAVFNDEETANLLYNAKFFLCNRLFKSSHFASRCKPVHYFNDIFVKHGGLMEPYIKDKSGQPGNNINGVMKGLFFSTKNPASSPFGDKKLCVNNKFFFNTKVNRIFFGDFYCHREIHYVVLVVTPKGSEVESYCDEKFIEITDHKNPFFRIADGNGDVEISEKITYFSTPPFYRKGFLLDIFYTESVQISEESLKDVNSTGYGSSRPGGCRNDERCGQCNLYPPLIE